IQPGPERYDIDHIDAAGGRIAELAWPSFQVDQISLHVVADLRRVPRAPVVTAELLADLGDEVVAAGIDPDHFAPVGGDGGQPPGEGPEERGRAPAHRVFSVDDWVGRKDSSRICAAGALIGGAARSRRRSISIDGWS